MHIKYFFSLTIDCLLKGHVKYYLLKMRLIDVAGTVLCWELCGITMHGGTPLDEVVHGQAVGAVSFCALSPCSLQSVPSASYPLSPCAPSPSPLLSCPPLLQKVFGVNSIIQNLLFEVESTYDTKFRCLMFEVWLSHTVY